MIQMMISSLEVMFQIRIMVSKSMRPKKKQMHDRFVNWSELEWVHGGCHLPMREPSPIFLSTRANNVKLLSCLHT